MYLKSAFIFNLFIYFGSTRPVFTVEKYDNHIYIKTESSLIKHCQINIYIVYCFSEMTK